MRRNSRYVDKFVITLVLRFEYTLPILPVYRVKLVLLVFVERTLLRRFMYCFVVNNSTIQITDKVRNIKWRTNEAGSKSLVSSIYSDDDFAKVYNAVVCRINAVLYNINSVQSLQTHSVDDRIRFAEVISIRVIVCHLVWL